MCVCVCVRERENVFVSLKSRLRQLRHQEYKEGLRGIFTREQKKEEQLELMIEKERSRMKQVLSI